MSNEECTFVVTAELDGESFEWLEGLRRRHFPPERNHLDAHLTLFHKLDAAAIEIVKTVIGVQAFGTMALRFDGLRMLGRGVAVEVAAPELTALRAACAIALKERLTSQDSQPFRPHVTIQNKVDPDVAKKLYAELRTGYVERIGSTQALMVWRYLGGPWEFAERLSLGKGRTLQR